MKENNDSFDVDRKLILAVRVILLILKTTEHRKNVDVFNSTFQSVLSCSNVYTELSTTAGTHYGHN